MVFQKIFQDFIERFQFQSFPSPFEHLVALYDFQAQVLSELALSNELLCLKDYSFQVQ